MSLSYLLLYLGTDFALIAPERGAVAWLRHEAALLRAMLGWELLARGGWRR
jgi:hypothetical protein